MIVKGRLSLKLMRALDEFASMLLTPQLKQHIIINVVFRKKMRYLGLTTVEDYNVVGKPREFLIEIKRNQSEVETLKTLAHEMVHVRQFARGELNEEGTLWHGCSVARDLDYHEQPWEIEAHDLTEILYEEYVDVIRQTDRNCR